MTGNRRMWSYLGVTGLAAAAGALLASPAWAAGLGEARRGFGIGSALATLCCLIVVGLVLIGVGIGVVIGRRRRRSRDQ